MERAQERVETLLMPRCLRVFHCMQNVRHERQRSRFAGQRAGHRCACARARRRMRVRAGVRRARLRAHVHTLREDMQFPRLRDSSLRFQFLHVSLDRGYPFHT